MSVKKTELNENVPTRFSWPMRIFLGFYLFYMVFSCLATSVVNVLRWKADYKMETIPLALPSTQEIEDIRAGVHPDGWTSVEQRYQASFASLGRFFVPGMDPNLKQDLQSPIDYVKIPLLWLESRLLFTGELIGIGQRWMMFSNFVTEYKLPRFELVYEDGSKKAHRSECDPPEDLLQPVYPFWFNEKLLRPCYDTLTHPETRLGYFNFLQHKYQVNEAGSRLAHISLYEATYYFLPIGEEPKEWYQQQSGPPADQIRGPLWNYDVQTNEIFSTDQR